MDRDQANLAELRLPDMKNARGQIHIRSIEAQRFARPQAGACQQPDRHGERSASVRSIWRYTSTGRDERCQLSATQDTRRWNRPRSRKHARFKALGAWIEYGEILTEAANHAVATLAT